MESLPKSPVLEFPPDTLHIVRKSYNLHELGRMKEAIDILEEWVKQQPHLVKKDFHRDYLEITLICSKGYIERAKKRLDKSCTLRTFIKNLFGDYDLKNDFKHLFHEKLEMALMPTLTKEYNRLFIYKFNKMLDAKDFMDMYRACLIYFEYLRLHDYVNGYIALADFGDLNMMEFATKMNPVELRNLMTCIVEGYGVRLRGIYQMSPSKLIEALITIMKQVMSEKLGNRIHVLRNIEQIYEFVPKEILPKDYGGNGKTVAEYHDDWIEAMTTKEFTEYRKDMNKACTDETLRPVDTFNDQYMGLPGTFRALIVD